jgi:glycosyltransferase involved in cell wall biosynthesis
VFMDKFPNLSGQNTLARVDVQGEQFGWRSETEANTGHSQGALDGITLFRFAHMARYRRSGGVEAYLSDLNRHLLERNKMQILQMYLARKSGPIEIEQVGRGELVWIPSLIKGSQEEMTLAQRLRYRFSRLFNSHSWICHDKLFSTLENYKVNLAVFHWISEDSRTVLDYLANRRIPFAVVNHFQNSRLKHSLVRTQILGASGLGGVSGVSVPSFVGNRFINLSDGVDTDFFSIEKATPLTRKIEGPLILLPSRITEGKGHLDAISALSWLRRKGIGVVLAFVGLLENRALVEVLKRAIHKEHLERSVIFAGELDSRELRSWYAASDVVVLPTYAEGLGKVLLEAQAMERPVLAYNVGGVSEAIADGEGGYLLRKGDIEGLTKRIRECLEDVEQRHMMGARGRQFVLTKFSLSSLIRRHECFYCRAMQMGAGN